MYRSKYSMYRYICHRLSDEVTKAYQEPYYKSPLLYEMFRDLSFHDTLRLARYYKLSMYHFPVVLFRMFDISNYVCLKVRNEVTNFTYRV